jgi:hypothetical protein
MPQIRTRTRVAALLTAALVTCGVLAVSSPAEARTWDHDRTDTVRFTVAGKPWTLREVAVGHEQQTIHVGQHSGTVWSRYRLTFKDDHGHVLDRVERHLYKQSAIAAAFSGRHFATVSAFRSAKHRALTITAARAKAQYLKGLRLESIDADVETNIGQVLDYLQTLPADAKPDFDAVVTIHSNEYRGSVTISGTDRKHWSVIVRDTQDGRGTFYDAATGSGSTYFL